MYNLESSSSRLPEIFLNLSSDNIDLIFLDGLHTYEQTIKDIDNSLNYLKKNGLIVIHDCLPKKIWNQIVPRLYGHWNGDVWKAIVDLRQREDLDIFTCEIDQGIGIITKRKNSSILKLNKPAKNLKFKDYYYNYKEYLRIIKLTDFKKLF